MTGKNEANVRRYRVLASVYDFFARNPLIERPRKRQFELAGIQPGDRVLVVGIGTGLDLEHIPPGAAVTGIDQSAQMLRRAELKDRDCTLLRMNAERLDFPDDSFDVVVMNCILSVVERPAKALGEAARVLAPGGSIWILGKFFDSEPSPIRRALSRVMIAIGGADLTLSLGGTIGDAPLRAARYEPDRLVDIVELVRS